MGEGLGDLCDEFPPEAMAVGLKAFALAPSVTVVIGSLFVRDEIGAVYHHAFVADDEIVLPLRDVGELIGVSHQRVSQLLAS